MRHFPTLLFACLLCAATARADVNMLAAMFPEAAKLAPPEWVKPGTRITWYVADGTQSPDPKKRGAGHGYSEVFVVAMEPSKIAMEVRFYLLGVQPSGPASPNAVKGTVSTTPGVVNQCWVHPTVLEKALKQPPADSKVAAAKLEIGGKQYDTVLVSYAKDDSTFLWTFDRKSGLVLKRSEKHGSEQKGMIMSASGELRDVAQIQYPWAGQNNPGWLANVNEIRFRGTQRLPAAPNIAVPLASRYRKKAAGKQWAMFEVTHGSGMTQQQADAALDAFSTQKTMVVSGSHSPSGLWIDSAALARLRKGQVIMKNPITGITVSVFYVGLDRGQDICVLRWGNRLGYVDVVYDRKSGGLVRSAVQDELRRLDFTLAGTR